MQKTKIQLTEIQLIGITERTNNTLEKDPSTAKIGATIQRYFQGNFSEKIMHRKNPGVTYCAYTGYDSDFTGNYTYFIGEEVNASKDLSEGLIKITIPGQKYVKFTSNSGAMPEVCINVWQKIWSMSPKELGGRRAYIADFEVYDERSIDYQNAALDIYIGVQE